MVTATRSKIVRWLLLLLRCLALLLLAADVRASVFADARRSERPRPRGRRQ